MSSLDVEPGAKQVPLSLSNRYVPVCYRLAAAIDHLKPTFSAHLDIDLITNASCSDRTPPVRFEITLNSSKLVFKTATLRAGSDHALKIVYNRQQEAVTFFSEDAAAVAAIDSAPSRQLVLEYVGQINTIKTYSDPTFGLYKTNYSDSISGTSSNYIVATHNQPCFTRRIFPLIDEIAFKALIELEVTTLNRFKVISNGALRNKTTVSMTDLAVSKFEPTPPMLGHLFALIAGDLETRQQVDETLGVPITFYAPLGEGHKTNYALLVAHRLLPALGARLQTPYPLAKLDFVALPFLSDVVMENWGVITLHKEQILDMSTPRQVRQLVAHELVHQWVGNLVSFDGWQWMWLNEAFATWLGNFILSEVAIEREDRCGYEANMVLELRQVMSLRVCITDFIDSTARLETSTQLSTAQLFDRDVYEKAICVLNMVATLIGDAPGNMTAMFAALQRFLAAYRFKATSPVSLWQTCGANAGQFVELWMKSDTFATVECAVDGEKVMVRAVADLPELSLPVFVKTVNAIKPVVLLTKVADWIEVPQVAPSEFVALTVVGLYRVKYAASARVHLRANSRHLTPADWVTIFSDYGSTQWESPHDLAAFLDLVCCLGDKSCEVDFDVLKVALANLETINNILMHHSEYAAFGRWLDAFTQKVFDKMGGWDQLDGERDAVGQSEMTARNSLLMLNLHNAQFQAVGRRLYKNLLHPGINKAFTAKELVPAILNLTMSVATQKEYKQILALVKNSDVSVLSNTDCTKEHLQTCAVSSLAFANYPDLLAKTLNFVLTNIDSKMIELALIGFQYKRDRDSKLRLFNWYSLHYNTLILRSLQKNSSWLVQLRSTMQNITKIVLGEIMVYDRELSKLKLHFVDRAQKQLPQHGLLDVLNQHQTETDYKTEIGSYYEYVAAELGAPHCL